MKGYIEEGALVSCTFDMMGTPRELEKASERLVKYSSGERLLTEQDKSITVKFSCKMPAKLWGGLAALIAGIVVGALLVLSGPVGWVALGCIAATVISTAVVATCIHDCSDPLKLGEWIKYHDTVRIKGDKAILYNQSLLTCKKGGILLASETPAIAQSVSDSMKWNARSEVAVQILSQAVQGFIVGINAFDDVKFGDIGGDIMVIGTAVGGYVYGDMYKNLDRNQSFALGEGLTGVSFAMGALKIPGGSESWGDLFWAELGISIEYGSNVLEDKLNSNNSILTTKKDENGNLLPIEEQEIEEGNLKTAKTNSSSSSKKILSKNY